MNKKPKKTFDVLGSPWELYTGTVEEYPLLDEMDGYTDHSAKCIVVREKTDDCQVLNFEWCQNKIIRHEIIHAYLYESGLDGCMDLVKGIGGHPEQLVDWIAIQFPKIMKTYQELNVI